ncbi:helix-turn-helix transcriptional regulator [Bacillus sp. 03113]|uniref:helix-turn-helix domain-containing protein n=1 Tax=Bacillus sp. 03113 TaxID=2578211 RepID=UPI001142F700|nr:helix-turn-helix transcriptional regulator [Bacillus sp. 03113]
MELRLKEILAERGLEQKDIAEMTELSTRTVSELCSGKMKRYPKDALGKIAEVLEITDMNELFTINKK